MPVTACCRLPRGRMREPSERAAAWRIVSAVSPAQHDARMTILDARNGVTDRLHEAAISVADSRYPPPTGCVPLDEAAFQRPLANFFVPSAWCSGSSVRRERTGNPRHTSRTTSSPSRTSPASTSSRDGPWRQRFRSGHATRWRQQQAPVTHPPPCGKLQNHTPEGLLPTLCVNVRRDNSLSSGDSGGRASAPHLCPYPGVLIRTGRPYQRP